MRYGQSKNHLKEYRIDIWKLLFLLMVYLNSSWCHLCVHLFVYVAFCVQVHLNSIKCHLCVHVSVHFGLCAHVCFSAPDRLCKFSRFTHLFFSLFSIFSWASLNFYCTTLITQREHLKSPGPSVTEFFESPCGLLASVPFWRPLLWARFWAPGEMKLLYIRRFRDCSIH